MVSYLFSFCMINDFTHCEIISIQYLPSYFCSLGFLSKDRLPPNRNHEKKKWQKRSHTPPRPLPREAGGDGGWRKHSWKAKRRKKSSARKDYLRAFRNETRTSRRTRPWWEYPWHSLPLFILPCWHQRSSDFLVLLLCFSWPSFLQIWAPSRTCWGSPPLRSAPSTFSHLVEQACPVKMKWSVSRLPNSSLQKKSEKATPRKRKFESEVGSERRNPSRKARPRENFAVEEKSEPRPCKTPKNVDVETLLKVRVWEPRPAPALTDMGLMKERPQLLPMFWLWTPISAVSHSTYMYFLARLYLFSMLSLFDRAGGQTGAEEEEEPQCQEEPVWLEVSRWDYRRRPG